MSKAMDDVLTERMRQVSAEGWTALHDDSHTRGELAVAAAVYAAPHLINIRDMPWNIEVELDRSDLVKAAALLIAEIERIDRAKGGT